MLRRKDSSPAVSGPQLHKSTPGKSGSVKLRSRRGSKSQQPAALPDTELPRDAVITIASHARSSFGDNIRASHDLDFANEGRHSVVDNMLSSLNPDQSRLSNYASPAMKHRHQHSSSTTTTTTTTTNLSFFPSPGPSSALVHNHGRQPSEFDHLTSPAMGSKLKSDSPHKVPTPRSKDHSRKASRGSTNTTDNGLTLPPVSKSSRTRRRSASFDVSFDRRTKPVPLELDLTETYSHSFLCNDFESAPSPTVAGGPRRRDESPTTSAMLSRRNSNRSTKSLYSKQSRSLLMSDPGTPALPSSSYFSQSNLENCRADSLRDSSNPDPQVAQAKSRLKEKPGFFKRVFSRTPQTQPDAPSPRPQVMDLQPRKSSNPETEAGRDPIKIPFPPPPTIVKKPSSFFRRRKKSISDSAPAMPPHLQANVPAKADPSISPTSSLRRVMNPYINSPQTPTPRATKFSQSTLNTDQSRSSSPTTGDSSIGVPNHSRSLVPVPIPFPVLNSTAVASSAPASLPVPNQSQLGKAKDQISGPQIPPRIFATPAQLSAAQDTRQSPTTVNAKGKRRLTLDTHAASETRAMPTEPDFGFDGYGDLDKGDGEKDVFHSATSVVHPGPGFGEDHVYTTSSEPCDTRAPLSSDAPRHPKLDLRDRGSTHPTTTTTESLVDRRSSPDAQISNNTSTRSFSTGQIDVLVSNTSQALDTDGLTPRKVSAGLRTLSSGQIGMNPTLIRPESASSISTIDVPLPTEDDRRIAKSLFDGDESMIARSEVAAWLGEPGEERMLVRTAYLDLFTWNNMSILASLRSLCSRLYLKAESQHLDRLLTSFAQRWCCCNPKHGFQTTGIVYAICYSTLILNTDQYQPGVEHKMTRSQFLRNTLDTIDVEVRRLPPGTFLNNRASTLPFTRPFDLAPQRPEPISRSSTAQDVAESSEQRRPSFSTKRSSEQQIFHGSLASPSLDSPIECGPLVRIPFHGKFSAWESQLEIVLKEIFASIRHQPLPLFSNVDSSARSFATVSEQPSSINSLNPASASSLRRTPSILSKAGSDALSFTRGRMNDNNRLGAGRWQGKQRSRPRVYASSSRSSFDEGSSPSITSGWSRYSSTGKTQTTMSSESVVSKFPEFQQSIGFANALSQAIIREEGTGGEEESLRTGPVLEDESLELAGAPWAKEGNLKHKHHLEAPGRRAKTRDRSWTDCFAVIEKGQMQLFSFSTSAKTIRQKMKSQRTTGGVVGGGNWADNAELLCSFVLRHTIASVMPPPGYSKTRPNVWALTLPTGALHLFQVGTPEIVVEFVRTANYWSARLSKEPLTGALSNIEYGWSNNVIATAAAVSAESHNLSDGGAHPNNTVVSDTAAQARTRAGSTSTHRPSMQVSVRSGRSSIDHGSFGSIMPAHSSGSEVTNTQRITVNHWSAPPLSMVASALLEIDQITALGNYLRTVEEELERHNELRGVVLSAFPARSANATKAMTNWGNKSKHLLAEHTKFSNYLQALNDARESMVTVYRDRAARIKEREADMEQEGSVGNAAE